MRRRLQFADADDELDCQLHARRDRFPYALSESESYARSEPDPLGP